MAKVRIPRMPTDLDARDPMRRGAIQTGAPVFARALSRAEDAVAHLAAARPMPAPVAARLVTLTTSYQVLRLRLATPVVPRLAVVHGVVRAAQPDIIDVRAATSFDATVHQREVVVGPSAVGAPMAFEIAVVIGDGTPAAAANAAIDVVFEVKKRNAGIASHLMSVGVSPVPIDDFWVSPPDVIT